jgi:hypothetical protein
MSKLEIRLGAGIQIKENNSSASLAYSAVFISDLLDTGVALANVGFYNLLPLTLSF